MVYLLLISGFILLIKGADLFVDGSSNIARAFHVSPLLIGLTIVALGTSSPEATISIIAALNENTGVALGNVVGSNIINTALVVGVAAFIYPLEVKSETIRKEIPFTLLAGVVLLILVSDITLQEVNENLLSKGDGLVILLFFGIFLYYIFEVARNSREKGKVDSSEESHTSWVKNAMITLAGLVGIIFGGDLVVRNATEIALNLGMSQTLAGLTIVAIGTSLPELITSITAAKKKESEIALGNIIGSNIFNILFVLGTTAAIHPLAVNSKITTDIIIMIFLTVILLLFSRSNYKIGKAEGIFLIIAYVLYMIFIIIRN
ncbi:calcium/sodium antiporter [Rossellomorea vietnamensis]|uniref:Calcium/sodium antiporter n=2 Tax=Rossellomorea TaxID=2837508 RepID=A0A5D4KKQ3_9BACI|nr:MULTISPECIES: calcium/sodium antiporter [Rossellomorea]TYR77470.1 calcium/sodium antiporter [Rossellomorea vietnamensis]TYS82412.1 calcium/sodium antiporter [Rossellomorea aquimaris]